MTGSGTLLDPYIIEDVDDLQAIEDDLAAYYELGQDIDASNTVTWNDGLGFIPISADQLVAIPTSDLSDAGVWTLFPLGGTFTSKVQPIPDSHGGGGYEGDDYIETNVDNSEVLFNFTPPAIPTGQTIMRVIVRCKGREVVSGAGQVNGILRIGGVNHHGAASSLGADWGFDTTTFNNNPATGVGWTVADIATIQGIGIRVGTALPAGTQITEVDIEVGLSGSPNFTGHFDGKDHIISNLTVKRYHNDNNGLFASIYEATLQNIHLKDVSIKGNTYVGGLVGVDWWTSTIFNCTVTGYIEAVRYGSLLVGFSSFYSSFGQCYTTGRIVAVRARTNMMAGGLAGFIRDATVNRCFSIIEIDPSSWGLEPTVVAGGLFGQTGGVVTVNESYAYGVVNASEYAAGFAVDGDNCIIENGYARVDIDSQDGTTETAGFITWLAAPASITNAYAAGKVVGLTGRESGFVDTSSLQDIIACFWDTETSETEYTQGSGLGPTFALGKLTSWMKQRENFEAAGWDFETIWLIHPLYNDGYPCLRGVPTYPFVDSEGVRHESPPGGPLIPWQTNPISIATVTTDPATDTSVLNGTLNYDGGVVCSCGFEWGLTPAYGNTTPGQNRTMMEAFQQAIGGLAPNTTYHYRAYATNTVGTAYGADRTFVTPASLPTVTTDPVTGLGMVVCALNGTLDDDGGEACDCGFLWGLTPAYGNTTPTQSRGTGETFSAGLTGLFPNATYHLRAFATNSGGTAYGADRSFTTVPAFSRGFALAREEL